MDRLGPHRSPEQVFNFFRWAFRLQRGPTAGRRFNPEREQHQARWIREFYGTLDSRGRRVYTRGLFGGPKGTGKTPFAAGLGHYELCSVFDDVPLVFALAGSKEQAGKNPDHLDRLHAAARAWADADPLADYLRAAADIRCLENGGVFRILTSDGRLAAGVDPTFWLLEEFFLFRHQREREAVNALLRSQKRGEGGTTGMAITTAGWDKTTPLGEMFDAAMQLPDLEVLENGCLTIARDPASGFLMHWYAVPEDGDIENPRLLKAANPLSTVVVRDLLRDLHAPGTDELDWRRLVANQWTVVRAAWLPLGTWARLAEDGAKIPDGAAVSVAVDAAFSWDTTAVVVAWRRPSDGRIVLEAHSWTLRRDAPGHVFVDEPTLDNERLVEPYILGHLALDRGFRIKHVVYDPNKFLTEGKHLAEAGLVAAPIWPQGQRMREAENEFFKATKNDGIRHDGDPIFRAHVAAMAGRRGSDGHWHISKLERNRPIDIGTAAVMATFAELTLEDLGEDEGDDMVAMVVDTTPAAAS